MPHLKRITDLPPRSKVCVGIDVSKGSWHLTVRSGGETLLGASCPARPAALEPLLRKIKTCRVQSVYEAGPFGYGLHDWLTRQGVESMVVSPAQVPVEVGNRVKTDRRDSLKLASTLEAGLLRPIYIPDEVLRAHRDLVRERGRLQRHRRSAMGRLKSLFLFHGIEIPFPQTSHWGGAFDEWLRGLVVPNAILTEVIARARDLYFDLDERLEAFDKRLRALAHAPEFAASTAFFTTVPGIGPLSALIIAVEVGDWSRFANGEAFSAYVGLTPSEYSSGESIRHGRITRTGNTHLRTLLVEASWTLIRKDPSMGAFYEKIEARRGAKRAIVAVARKLCLRLVAMAKTGEVYRIGG
jgi:transposase